MSAPLDGRLSVLERNRDRLDSMLDVAPPSSAASIAKELRMTLADIAELVPAKKESTLDELKQRRDKGAVPVAPSRRRRRVAGG